MLSQSGQVTHLAVARTASSCLATRRPPGAAADSREGYLAVMAALFRVLADTQRGSGGDGSAPAPSAALSAVLVAVPEAMMAEVEAFLATAGYSQMDDPHLQVFLQRVLTWPLSSDVWSRVRSLCRAASTARRTTALAAAVVVAAGAITTQLLARLTWHDGWMHITTLLLGCPLAIGGSVVDAIALERSRDVAVVQRAALLVRTSPGSVPCPVSV